MKVSNSNSNLVNQAYGNNPAQKNIADNPQKSDKNADAKPSSSVDLSSKTRDMQKVLQTIESEPVARTEKINRIQNEINENRYKIDTEKIAEKMAGTFLDEII